MLDEKIEKKKEKPLTAKFVLRTGNESAFEETSTDISVKKHTSGGKSDYFSHFLAALFKCGTAIKTNPLPLAVGDVRTVSFFFFFFGWCALDAS